jgi:hypothetical protein
VSQRISGYERQERKTYPTPPAPVWPLVPILCSYGIFKVLEPAPTPDGHFGIAAVLRAAEFDVVVTDDDFLKLAVTPPGTEAIISNPPYGHGGKTAIAFIERALWLAPLLVAMLLKIDFDSGKTREHLFGKCASFAGKIVLLDRIVWFARDDGKRAAPSDNHAWFIWNAKHRGPPIIHYARSEKFEFRGRKPAAQPTETLKQPSKNLLWQIIYLLS